VSSLPVSTTMMNGRTLPETNSLRNDSLWRSLCKSCFCRDLRIRSPSRWSARDELSSNFSARVNRQRDFRSASASGQLRFHFRPLSLPECPISASRSPAAGNVWRDGLLTPDFTRRDSRSYVVPLSLHFLSTTDLPVPRVFCTGSDSTSSRI